MSKHKLRIAVIGILLLPLLCLSIFFLLITSSTTTILLTAQSHSIVAGDKAFDYTLLQSYVAVCAINYIKQHNEIPDNLLLIGNELEGITFNHPRYDYYECQLQGPIYLVALDGIIQVAPSSYIVSCFRDEDLINTVHVPFAYPAGYSISSEHFYKVHHEQKMMNWLALNIYVQHMPNLRRDILEKEMEAHGVYADTQYYDSLFSNRSSYPTLYYNAIYLYKSKNIEIPIGAMYAGYID